MVDTVTLLRKPDFQVVDDLPEDLSRGADHVPEYPLIPLLPRVPPDELVESAPSTPVGRPGARVYTKFLYKRLSLELASTAVWYVAKRGARVES